MSDAGIDYDDLADVAECLIEANGQTVSITRLSRQPADANKPWRGPVTSGPTGPETITTIGVILPNEEKDDKEAMKRGDATAFIAALTFEDGSPLVQKDLEEFDTLTDLDGRIWRVLNVDIINPGGIRVYYEVQLNH